MVNGSIETSSTPSLFCMRTGQHGCTVDLVGFSFRTQAAPKMKYLLYNFLWS